MKAKSIVLIAALAGMSYHVSAQTDTSARQPRTTTGTQYPANRGDSSMPTGQPGMKKGKKGYKNGNNNRADSMRRNRNKMNGRDSLNRNRRQGTMTELRDSVHTLSSNETMQACPPHHSAMILGNNRRNTVAV